VFIICSYHTNCVRCLVHHFRYCLCSDFQFSLDQYQWYCYLIWHLDFDNRYHRVIIGNESGWELFELHKYWFQYCLHSYLIYYLYSLCFRRQVSHIILFYYLLQLLRLLSSFCKVFNPAIYVFNKNTIFFHKYMFQLFYNQL